VAIYGKLADMVKQTGTQKNGKDDTALPRILALCDPNLNPLGTRKPAAIRPS
jgi:hypothetical protein